MGLGNSPGQAAREEKPNRHPTPAGFSFFPCSNPLGTVSAGGTSVFARFEASRIHYSIYSLFTSEQRSLYTQIYHLINLLSLECPSPSKNFEDSPLALLLSHQKMEKI